MPNWCDNKLIVTGKKSEINKMLAFVKGKDDRGIDLPFDFEKILPTPGDMSKEQSPPISTEKALANEIEYGFPDWYTWRVAKWGTKWNLTGDTTILNKKGGCEILFSTAWSPPSGIITKLSEEFPNLNFRLVYLEEGMCFAGIFEGEKGSFSDYCVEASKDDRAYRKIMEEYFPDSYQSMLDYEEEKEEQE